MKKFLILASLAALFLFSFTLMNDEGKASDGSKENEKSEVAKSSNNTKAKEASENVEKLDFSKIKTSNENPDFDAHAGLD